MTEINFALWLYRQYVVINKEENKNRNLLRSVTLI